MSEFLVFGVLVTYKRPHELVGSLDALARQTRQVDRLVVVNNDPDGPLPTRVTARDGDAVAVEYLDTGENLGPAGGIAVGMLRALESAIDADCILILDDDDPLVDDHVVADLADAVAFRRKTVARLGGLGLRGARLNRTTGRLTKARPEDGWADVDYLKSDWAPMYSVSAVREVGVFRSELFFGFDDMEFGTRLVAAGFRVEAHELGRVDQSEQQQASREYSRSPWRTYYTIRNLLVILWGLGLRRAALRTALVTGTAKPLVNLVVGPSRSPRQAQMSLRAVWDAARGRLGRTVTPATSKLAATDE